MKRISAVNKNIFFLFALAFVLSSAFTITRLFAQESRWLDGASIVGSQATVPQVIAVLRDENLQKNDPKRVVEAIERAGDLEAVEAIDALTELLTFKRADVDEANEIHLHSLATLYPAIQALTSIGKRSLPALIEVIKKEESNSLASNNAIFAILYFFREEPSEGVHYFEAASNTAPTPAVAQRLLHVAKKIDEFYKIK
jgi:hypothetical protein